MLRATSLAAAALAAALLAGRAGACTVTTAPVAFGSYSTTASTPLDGVGTVTLRCHRNTLRPLVEVSPGSSGSFGQRAMRKGSELLLYNLYTSPARLIVFGDGTGGSSPVTAGDGVVTSNVRTIEVPIYGRIPARQPVGEGAYEDTLFVTVTF